MGTWGITAFEDDIALDWTFGLEESGQELIRDTLLLVRDCPADEYLDSAEASEALAAVATVVVARTGFGSEHLTEDVEDWLAGSKYQPDQETLELCRAALKRILADNSELRDVWEETSDYQEWLKYMQELSDKLG